MNRSQTEDDLEPLPACFALGEGPAPLWRCLSLIIHSDGGGGGGGVQTCPGTAIGTLGGKQTRREERWTQTFGSASRPFPDKSKDEWQLKVTSDLRIPAWMFPESGAENVETSHVLEKKSFQSPG